MLQAEAQALLQRLAREPAVWVQVQAVRGSIPRDVGTGMAVFADALMGTVGGGRLEFEAIAHARALLGGDAVAAERRFPLGPELGQCCGGVVHLGFERFDGASAGPLAARLAAARQQHMPVALFGGGHVGHALVQVLALLPVRVHWVDSREGQFPAQPPLDVVCEHSEPVHAAVPLLESGSRVLVMSFSHAEDLDVVAACLQRLRHADDLPYIGLIGSRSKWARFQQRLRQRGFTEAELARITCPIGVEGVVGKEPATIAVAVAAQLLRTRTPVLKHPETLEPPHGPL